MGGFTLIQVRDLEQAAKLAAGCSIAESGDRLRFAQFKFGRCKWKLPHICFDTSQAAKVLTRIFGVENLALAEDMVQDAFCRALEVWAFRGVPENPSARLMTAQRTERSIFCAAKRLRELTSLN